MVKLKSGFPPIIVAIMLMGILFVTFWVFVSSVRPKYIGDASAYKYKVVMTSIWFDLPKKVTALHTAEVRRVEYVYYTNEYSVQMTSRWFDRSIDFTMRKLAYFIKGEDGNYRLIAPDSIATNYTYSSSNTLHIAVIEQSSNKVVFNSARELDTHPSP